MINWQGVLWGKWSWWRPLRLILLVYVGLFLVAVFFLDHLLFLPPAPSYGEDLRALVHFDTSATETIGAVYFPADEGMPTLLFSHGNAEDLGHSMELFEAWHDRGLGVLAYDYPGYGRSSGRPSVKGCERAIAGAWKFLQDMEVAPSECVVVSRSVGGGPGLWLAAQHEPAGVVLISCFTSVYQVKFPVPLFPNEPFPNQKRLQMILAPLLVIHGERDRVIPISHGRRLYERSPSADKRLWEIPDAGHNDLFFVAGDSIADAVAEFAIKVTEKSATR